MPTGFPRPGRKTAIAACIAAVLAASVAAFDWNWLRGPLESYLAEKSRRDVRIGHLDVEFDRSLNPTVRLRDVRIENAPWADKRPFMVAGEAAFTVSLRSLWDEKTIISRLVLVDAELDMERQADGLRNWRLRTPEYRGPGKVKVLRLQPTNTTIRFVRRDVGLDVQAAAGPAGARGKAEPDDTHPLRVTFRGNFGDAHFEGDVDTAAVLTFFDTGEPFQIRGSAASGGSRLQVDGTIADLLDPSSIDGKVSLAGKSLADLHPLLRARLPASRAFDLQAHVTQTARATSFAELTARIGGTDLAGELVLNRGTGKPSLKAALKSRFADLDDIGPLVGRPHAKAAAVPSRASAAGTAAGEGERGGHAARRLFSDDAFDGRRLAKLDAHVDFAAAKFHASQVPALQSLRLTADLAGGVLRLDPVDAGIADGRVRGHFSFDGNRQPFAARAKLDFRDVRMEQLLAGLTRKARAAGPLHGHVDLEARGNSMAALAASASGPAEVDLDAGGISNLVDAVIGLEVGKAAKAVIAGDRFIGVNNARIAFDFERGRGTSRIIVLDTEHTHTEGNGDIDLRNETLDVLLTPYPKKPGVLRLHSSIRVHGPIREPRVALAKADAGPREGGRGMRQEQE